MEILAGLVCGLLMGLVFLAAGIAFVLSNPNLPERLAKVLPQNLSPNLVMLLFMIVVPPLWGLLGALAGLLYWVADDIFPGSGMGSSNFAFTLAVFSLTVLVVVLITVLTRRKHLRLPLAMTVAFGGIFGWILPLLASR